MSQSFGRPSTTGACGRMGDGRVVGVDRRRQFARRAMQRHRRAGGPGLRDIQRLRHLRRRGQAVGPSRHWRQVGTGRRFAIAARPGVGCAMHRQIEMKMIVMKHVGAGAQYRGEMLARPGMGFMKEGRFLRIRLFPVLDDDDAAAVRQFEAGNVDRIAERMFGKLRAGDIVDAAATIGAERRQSDHRLAKMGLRGRLHHLRQPVLQCGNHRTIDRHRPLDRDRPIGQSRHFERMGEPANAGSVNFM